jgi:3-methylfumaryl-CoA hydratase
MKQARISLTDQERLALAYREATVPILDAKQVDYLKTWIGKQEVYSETISRTPLVALAAVLDRSEPEEMGNVVPPLWHWLFYSPIARQSELGVDGHPGRGGFLPPVPLPRRMWAGSRLRFNHPIPIGQCAVRHSVIDSLTYKHGRSGSLIIVTVRHDIKDSSDSVLLTEEQDIIYRHIPGPGVSVVTPTLAPFEPEWTQRIDPDAILLFRYSALTFNGHRIHYDRPYATEVENYPGLVVHGPLIATLLLELLEKHLPGAHLTSCSIRAISPLFDTAPFLICGRHLVEDKNVSLWAQKLDGSVAMLANVTLA